MQVTKGTWCMHEQCVPGSLSSSPTQEPGNKAKARLFYLSKGARVGCLGVAAYQSIFEFTIQLTWHHSDFKIMEPNNIGSLPDYFPALQKVVWA